MRQKMRERERERERGRESLPMDDGVFTLSLGLLSPPSPSFNLKPVVFAK
jgi:hypothetical protein